MRESSSEPREVAGIRKVNLVLYERRGHLARGNLSY